MKFGRLFYEIPTELMAECTQGLYRHTETNKNALLLRYKTCFGYLSRLGYHSEGVLRDAVGRFATDNCWHTYSLHTWYSFCEQRQRITRLHSFIVNATSDWIRSHLSQRQMSRNNSFHVLFNAPQKRGETVLCWNMPRPGHRPWFDRPQTSGYAQIQTLVP
jgi:hypothetical protein